MMSLNGSQMPIIVSDKKELRRCTMHLWPNFNGLGLILKYSLNENTRSPHIIKQVEVDSPAYYAGVLNNDLIIKVGNRLVETEKFDQVLKLIKEQLKKEKKCDLLLINSEYYPEFRQKYEMNGRVDYNSASVSSQIKYYQSPLFNPNRSSVMKSATLNNSSTLAQYDMGAPEPRLCHLLTWSNYDGYGFYTAFNNDGCFIRNVEPNSPAQLGGLRDYDRILEVNGKQVSSKDREFIMKQINKHKLGSKNTNTLKSQSAYSIGTSKSNKSSISNNLSNNIYLTLLVADPNTFKWLTDRRIQISTRNKNLKIHQCYTPPENSILQLMNQQQHQHHQSNSNTVRSSRSNNTILRSNDVPSDILMKRCTVRRLKDQENEPLGLEMTKFGNSPNFINNVIPASSAALSGLCKDDYLIELNDQNIEDLDNSTLRERIFHFLRPENGGEFSLTTINKVGYEYCIENSIKPGNFIQINRHNLKEFQTPREKSSLASEEQLDQKQHSIQRITPNIIPNLLASKENKSTSTSDSPIRITNYLNHIPRICVLHKTNENEELGFSIARMKNFNEHIINEVVPGSLADVSGLKPNDCLLEVNGENVENKSHGETVKKISELKKLKNVDINLLVVQKEHLNIQNSIHNANNLNKTSSISTPDLVNMDNLSNNKNIVTIINNNLPRSTSNKKLDSVSTLPISNCSNKNKNNYPEIKVCEFIGYPKGTQLGLVVTSDECSHDIVKVAENSPASKCGIQKDDVIISVNDVNVEGNPSSIELLNDFGENKPLKILVASKFAYEWSKLLQIKIAEKDWPNIKKTTNRYLGISGTSGSSTNDNNIHNQDRYRSLTNYESSYYETNRNYLAKSAMTKTNFTDNDFNSFDPRNSLRNHIFYRSSSANDNYNDILLNGNRSGTVASSYTPNMSNNIQYKRPVTSASTVRSTDHSNQLNYSSTLGRSAVDITADGRVLRLCTLILDPNSPIPTDSEFGFDLVTKIGANQRISDYHIDTIDENSPASRSGLRPGDRLVEVDGIDVTSKTFEQVVQLINEAKLRSKLKLLVYPSTILNYGNPNISSQNNINYQANLNSPCIDSRSLPDLTIQQNYNNSLNNTNVNEFSKSMFKKKNTTLNKYPLQQHYQHMQPNDYDSIYLKRNGFMTNTNLSKSSSNLYDSNPNSNNIYNTQSILRPVPRLCTIFKHETNSPQYISPHTSANIGFGVNTKLISAALANYMRVSLVNYKSPAYLSGLETGDLIFEINGRNTLAMTHEEALHFIKSSYEVNGYVKLLVVSEFTFNWLKENELLSSINSEDRNVFSYADYLKHNHRFVPRLCKIKLFPFSKSFGFSIETILIRPSANNKFNNKIITNINTNSGIYQSYAHIIMRVDRDSPANSSSLLKGDRIIECDGINVENESEQQLTERIYQAFVSAKQITLFVVDPDTDNFFKSKCIKLHSMLPIVQHITNSTDI